MQRSCRVCVWTALTEDVSEQQEQTRWIRMNKVAIKQAVTSIKAGARRPGRPHMLTQPPDCE